MAKSESKSDNTAYPEKDSKIAVPTNSYSIPKETLSKLRRKYGKCRKTKTYSEEYRRHLSLQSSYNSEKRGERRKHRPIRKPLPTLASVLSNSPHKSLRIVLLKNLHSRSMTYFNHWIFFYSLKKLELHENFSVYKTMLHSIMISSMLTYTRANLKETFTADWGTRLNDCYFLQTHRDVVIKFSFIVHENEVITIAWDIKRNRVRSIHVNISNFTQTPRDPEYDKENMLFISTLIQFRDSDEINMTNSTLKRSECDNVRMQVLNDNCEISSRRTHQCPLMPSLHPELSNSTHKSLNIAPFETLRNQKEGEFNVVYHRFLNLLQYNMLRENCQCFFIYKLMIHSIMSSMSYIPENSEESLTGDWATRLNDSYLHDSREDLVLKISSIVHDNEVITTAWDVNKNRVRSIHVNIANYTRTPRDPAYDKEQLLFISALMHFRESDEIIMSNATFKMRTESRYDKIINSV